MEKFVCDNCGLKSLLDWPSESTCPKCGEKIEKTLAPKPATSRVPIKPTPAPASPPPVPTPTLPAGSTLERLLTPLNLGMLGAAFVVAAFALFIFGNFSPKSGQREATELFVFFPEMNVRTSPEIRNGNIAGQIKQTDRLKLLGAVNSNGSVWYKVKHQGRVVYVSSKGVINLRGVPPMTTLVVLVDRDQGQIKALPDTGSETLAKVTPGFFFALNNASPQNGPCAYTGGRWPEYWFTIYHNGRHYGYLRDSGTLRVDR
jgi:hypothetical protein